MTAAYHKGMYADPMYTPDGWTPAQSKELAENFVYHAEMPERLKHLGKEGELDVYLDKKSGKKLYLGRSSGH